MTETDDLDEIIEAAGDHAVINGMLDGPEFRAQMAARGYVIQRADEGTATER